jgi:hypothetical protein
MNKSAGSIKQKVKINENPDYDIFIKPVLKTRVQELADCRREREFSGLDDDLHKLLMKSNATLLKSEEYLPTTSANDKQTLTRQRLDQQRGSRNRAQNRYWTRGDPPSCLI